MWTTPAEGPNDACHVVIVGTCSTLVGVMVKGTVDFLWKKVVDESEIWCSNQKPSISSAGFGPSMVGQDDM